MTNLDVILSYIFGKSRSYAQEQNFGLHISHVTLLWKVCDLDLFSSELTCNESSIPVVTDILSQMKKQIREVSVDLFLTGAFARNQANICNDNFDWSTE